MREGQQQPLVSSFPDPTPIAVGPGARDAIVLGFDFGLRRIGVALGNGITRGARPLALVKAASIAAPSLWQDLGALVTQWQPTQLVVGIARHPDGRAHDMTGRCERFARQLEGRFGLPVARVDERYSTAVLPGNAATDDHAAAIILQQWFDEGAHLPGLAPAHSPAPSPAPAPEPGAPDPLPSTIAGRPC